MSPLTIGLVLGVLFLAGLVKATMGFGESMVAMPLLILLIGVQMASPLTAMVMTTLTTILLLQNWQRADLRSIWRVMLAAVLGIPLGVWGLRALPARWIMLGLGLVLVTMGLYYMTRPVVRWVPGPRWGFVFGFASGVLGGAITAGGPPIIIFGTLRRLAPEEFRATLQGCFAPLNFFVMLGHALGGLWTAPVVELYLYSLPLILGALWLGNRLHRAIPAKNFNGLVYLGLIALGVIMVGQSMIS